ncbi:MAG: hypothetical protein ACR2K2_04675 [Mycobacteriales bacterium]
MDENDPWLRTALRSAAADAPAGDDLVQRLSGADRPRRWRGWRGWVAPIAAAAAVVVLAMIAVRQQSDPPIIGGAPSNPPATQSCRDAVQISTLPSWARGGFTPPKQPVSHTTGRNGSIVAVGFGRLTSPPRVHRFNKVLWVSRLPVRPGSPLQIHAVLNGRGDAVDREVAGGPGPSTLDLPAAGCWTLTLSWSGHTDTLSLRYYRPGSGPKV